MNGERQAWQAPKCIEKHLLFPKDYLKTELGVTSPRKTNQVANLALVEWSDNIGISNDPPDQYWPNEVADKNIDDDRRRRRVGGRRSGTRCQTVGRLWITRSFSWRGGA